MLNQARLKEVLHYDPSTGVFTNTTSRRGASAGAKAGYAHKYSGYYIINVDGKRYGAHRLAWLYVYGVWPPDELDHINGTRYDNRIANLREATRQQNNQNQALRIDNKSGIKGVYWHKQRNKWAAQINVQGKPKHLGLFTTQEEASAVYAAAAEKIFGEFVRPTKGVQV